MKNRRAKTLENTNRLFSNDFYYAYNAVKKKVLPKKHRMNNRDEYLKFCKLFFKIIQEELLERKAGVCIKDFGYLYVHLIPRKMPLLNSNKDKDDIYFFATDNRLYSLCYIPSKKFSLWSMDNQFNHNLVKGVHRRLLSGVRYKGYPFSTKNLT